MFSAPDIFQNVQININCLQQCLVENIFLIPIKRRCMNSKQYGCIYIHNSIVVAAYESVTAGSIDIQRCY